MVSILSAENSSPRSVQGATGPLDRWGTGHTGSRRQWALQPTGVWVWVAKNWWSVFPITEQPDDQTRQPDAGSNKLFSTVNSMISVRMDGPSSRAMLHRTFHPLILILLQSCCSTARSTPPGGYMESTAQVYSGGTASRAAITVVTAPPIET
jgi:hypothetical protein